MTMLRAEIWMLLAQSGPIGLAAQLSVNIAEGALGHGVRHVDVIDASKELQQSATDAIDYVYDLLAREKYLNRRLLVRITPGTSLEAATGDSGGLAFAIAFALTAAPQRDMAIAATGILGNDGSIQPVNAVAPKLAGALGMLPPGGMFIFPGGNERDVPAHLRDEAAARQITLLPSYRIEEVLAHLGFAITHTWLDRPFRGLEAFEFRHASIFFGREQEIDEALDLLNRRAAAGKPAILVRGASGSGKSSLVQAGVLPALMRRADAGQAWSWGLLRPITADAPGLATEALYKALYAAWQHGEPGGIYPPSPPPEETFNASALLAWLHRNAGERPDQKFVLVLDQMEGWFQGQVSSGQLQEFSELLLRLNANGVWIIGTITNAGANALNDYQALTKLFQIEGQYVLSTVTSAKSLDAMIKQPAHAAGLRFEAGLDTEIFNAASHGGPDVLPLLQMLLTELFERRDKAHNELRFADFHDVGGLDGVISARAEAAYESLDPGIQQVLPAMLWKLLTCGFILISEYPANHPMRRLIAAFAARRLLVIDERPHRAAVMASHEALFRHWPRVIMQVKQDDSDIKFYLDLAREAGQWARKERALIPAGPQLAAAASLIKRRAGDWSDIDQPVLNYVAQSARQMTRRRMVTYTAMGVPAVALASFTLAKRQNITKINFSAVAVDDSSDGVAAQDLLRPFGITLSKLFPADSIVVVRSCMSYYGGQAIDCKQVKNVLSQQNPTGAAPISFNMIFDKPVTAVRITRAPLWAATSSGVTHPTWTAFAFDSNGQVLGLAHEPLIRSFAIYSKVPEKTYTLHGGGTLISSVQIQSDFRSLGDSPYFQLTDEGGIPFAGVPGVLISEIDLVR